MLTVPTPLPAPMSELVVTISSAPREHSVPRSLDRPAPCKTCVLDIEVRHECPPGPLAEVNAMASSPVSVDGVLDDPVARPE